MNDSPARILFDVSGSALGTVANPFIISSSVAPPTVVNNVYVGGTTVLSETDATYLVLSHTASLTSERQFVPGTGLFAVDGGANGSYTVGINDGVVATVSGTNFTGAVKFSAGLSGSLTNLADGSSYLVGGSNIIITSASSGQVMITSTAPGGSDPGAQYLVLANTASLSNERALVASTGLLSTDGGSNSSYTLSIDDQIVATVSGTTFTGATKHSAGLSGSLTKLVDGTSYIVAGANITVTSASNGQITIASTASGTGGADTGASYVVLAATSSLANERVLTAGTGITITDGGAGGVVTISTTTVTASRGYYSASFVQANLVSGILPVTHSIGEKYVAVSVYDNNDLMVMPDSVFLNTTASLEVGLTAFEPIPGTWHVVVNAGASPRPSVVYVTGSYTASAENVVLCSTTTAGFTVTLPDALANPNSTVTVKKVSSDVNVLTIGTMSSQLIDGATTKSISQQWASTTMTAYGDAWYII